MAGGMLTGDSKEDFVVGRPKADQLKGAVSILLSMPYMYFMPVMS